jgi:hypothetical protein
VSGRIVALLACEVNAIVVSVQADPSDSGPRGFAVGYSSVRQPLFRSDQLLMHQTDDRADTSDRIAVNEYAPRTVWRITDSHGRTLDAIFLRTADRYTISIRLDGQAKDARDFHTGSDALAWAEERRTWRCGLLDRRNARGCWRDCRRTRRVWARGNVARLVRDGRTNRAPSIEKVLSQPLVLFVHRRERILHPFRVQTRSGNG